MLLESVDTRLEGRRSSRASVQAGSCSKASSKCKTHPDIEILPPFDIHPRSLHLSALTPWERVLLEKLIASDVYK
jgi:hypothetical protein